MPEGRRFRPVDYVVIAVLYVGNIMDVWTRGGVSLTDVVLFGDEYDDIAVESSRMGDVRIHNAGPISVFAVWNSLLALFVKCVLCLTLAFTADLRNRKFRLYFVSLCLWVLTPVVGIVTTLTRSPALALSLSWLAAVLFVTSPLKYCLIFNQRFYPLRDQTRLVVALFEFMISCCKFLLTACFPNSKTVDAPALVAVWAAVITPLGSIIILSTIAIRRYCTSEVLKERSLKELSLGIRQNILIKKDDTLEMARRKKAASLRFVMFILLLCPVIAVTVIFEAHSKVARTLTKQVKLERTWFDFCQALTNLMAIPLITLVVSLSKGTRGTLWDFLVLACAHVLNTVIMLLIFLYFHLNDFSNTVFIPKSKSADTTWVAPITKEVPGKGVAVVYVYFHSSGSKTFFFQSSLNDYPKKDLFVRESVPVKVDSLKYHFSVWEEGGVRLNQSILVREGKRYFFVATGTTLNLKEIIYVPDVKDFTPRNAGCIIVMSSIADGFGSDSAKNGTLSASQQGKVIESSRIPPANSSIQWCLPTGNTSFRYENSQTKFSPLTLELKPFEETVILVSWEFRSLRPHLMMVSYSAVRYGRTNMVKDRTESMLKASHGIEGVVAATATIGYVQFFWMEAPFRLRTTLFACLVVANEVAAWVVDLLVEEIEEKMSLALLILSASAGLVHVVLGALYEFKLRREE